MFTIVFIVVLTLTISVVNKKNEQKITDESLIFEGKDSLIIIFCLIASLLLNKIFSTYLQNIYLIASLISALPFSLIMTIANTNREKRIRYKQEQIIKIHEAAADILGKIKPENIDFEAIPFEFETDKDTDSINKIIFDTTKEIRVSDDINTMTTFSLNKYFPDFQWISEENVEERKVIFHGLPKPPKIAKYPGSDYRPNVFVPLGLSGQGEIGWYITKDSRGKGFSQFKYESGNYSGNVETVTTPQFLLGGSTGGGKFVWIEQKVVIKND